MTKKLKFHLFSSALLLLVTSLFSSCEKENFGTEEKLKFSISDAKKYHLEKATDLRFMNPNMNAVVKSNIDYNEILVPEWDKAKVFETEVETHTFITHEIPIKTGNIIGGVLIKKDSLNSEKEVKRVAMKCHLVIQEVTRKSDNFKYVRQFITTIIGNDKSLSKNSTAFNNMGNRRYFSGYRVVSELDGRIRSIFKYTNGKQQQMFVKHNNSASNSSYEGFSFLQNPSVKGGDVNHGGNLEPGTCGSCGKHDYIYVDLGLCEVCFAESTLLPDIEVTPKDEYCPNCNVYIESCICQDEGYCSSCMSNPCQCFHCPHCLSSDCDGNCQNSGSGDEEGKGSGSGSSSGSDNDNSGAEWWQGRHRSITENGLANKGLSNEQLQSIINGNLYIDSAPFQNAVNAFMHAMTPKGTSVEDAVVSMRNHFIECMSAYNNDNDYSQFGRGIHCIQDAYSPDHAFGYWGGCTLEYLLHISEGIFIYADKEDAATKATESIFDEINKCNGSEEEIGAIFDKWYDEYTKGYDNK